MNFIIENKELLISVLTAIIAFISGRKTKKLNEKSAELQNLEKVREMEKQLVKDMEEQVSKLIDYTSYLEVVVEAYKKEYGVLPIVNESKVN